jgi:DNA modification methylase
LVLDPFMGSGTTGRVSDKLDRRFVGYDLKGY